MAPRFSLLTGLKFETLDDDQRPPRFLDVLESGYPISSKKTALAMGKSLRTPGTPTLLPPSYPLWLLRILTNQPPDSFPCLIRPHDPKETPWTALP